jgi:Fe-S cluster biogenesis protein NfuA
MSDQERVALIGQIESALDDIRPHLAVDGGDVSVIDVTEEMTLRIKWLGACKACSMSAMTLKAGIEQTVKSRLPQIRAVEAVNELHA